MSGEFEMTIEAVREIANRTMGTMKSKAQASSRVFGDVDLPPAAFGGWQQGVALGRHHQGAHEVFMKTLEGVLADLEEFEQNLRDTADSSERRDEDVEASLLALGRGYRDRRFRSQERYTEAVEAESGRKGIAADELAAEAAATEAAASDAFSGSAGDPGATPDAANDDVAAQPAAAADPQPITPSF